MCRTARVLGFVRSVVQIPKTIACTQVFTFLLACLGDALVLGCAVTGVGSSRKNASPCSISGGEMWEPCLPPEQEDKPGEPLFWSLCQQELSFFSSLCQVLDTCKSGVIEIL